MYLSIGKPINWDVYYIIVSLSPRVHYQRFHCNSTTCVLLSQYAMLVLIGPVHVMYFEPY